MSRNLFTVETAAARDGWKTHLLREHDSEPYYDWLVHVGSLTGRLRQRCDDFRVALLRQELARPGRDEWAGLHLAHRDLAWVREVVLYCADTPMVFAHSVLPRGGVRGAWHLVAGLGTRPLGAILFADPLIRRMPFAYRRIDARHALYHKAVGAAYDDGGKAPPGLWARRSEFRRGGRPILVTEIFLPEILKLNP